MEPTKHVWNKLYEEFKGLCGEEEWKLNWFLFRQMVKIHWSYEDCFCEKHHTPENTQDACYSCYPIGTRSIVFHKEFLSLFSDIALAMGDYETAKKELTHALNNMERVGAVILDIPSNTFLLVQDVNKHSFMFPQGKINKSETYRECLVREIYEELHIELERTKVKEYCIIHTRCASKDIRLYCLLTHLQSSQITINPTEIASYKWLSLEKIEDLPKNSLFVVDSVMPILSRWIKSLSMKHTTKITDYFNVNRSDDEVSQFRMNTKAPNGYYQILPGNKKKKGVIEDKHNITTFGITDIDKAYTVEECIQMNERIEKKTIPRYDGNPNTFGDLITVETKPIYNIMKSYTPYFTYSDVLKKKGDILGNPFSLSVEITGEEMMLRSKGSTLYLTISGKKRSNDGIKSFTFNYNNLHNNYIK